MDFKSAITKTGRNNTGFTRTGLTTGTGGSAGDGRSFKKPFMVAAILFASIGAGWGIYSKLGGEKPAESEPTIIAEAQPSKPKAAEPHSTMGMPLSKVSTIETGHDSFTVKNDIPVKQSFGKASHKSKKKMMASKHRKGKKFAHAKGKKSKKYAKVKGKKHKYAKKAKHGKKHHIAKKKRSRQSNSEFASY